MAKKIRPRVKAPKKAKAGDIMEIKTLISHPMETGLRKGKDGKPIPRRIINKFEASYEGRPVFSADLRPAISANPYLSFNVKADKTGTLEFKWHDDNGDVYTAKKKVKVS